jgi:hypothetical protein
MINPYEFMGLTVDSSLDDLRKSYYKMSLICHPDKGGSPDAMVVLHTAYNWIKGQLENVKNQPDAGKDYDTVQKEFDEYVATLQKMKPPTYLETVAESLGIEKTDYTTIFDRVFEATGGESKMISKHMLYDIMLGNLNQIIFETGNTPDKEAVLKRMEDDLIRYRDMKPEEINLFPASIPHGYGDLMEGNDVFINHKNRDNIPLDVSKLANLDINADAAVPIKTQFEKREMIIYHEPDNICSSSSGVNNLPEVKKEDYTVYNKGVCLTDYKLAFSEEETENASSVFSSMISSDPVDVLKAVREVQRDKFYMKCMNSNTSTLELSFD